MARQVPQDCLRTRSPRHEPLGVLQPVSPIRCSCVSRLRGSAGSPATLAAETLCPVCPAEPEPAKATLRAAIELLQPRAAARDHRGAQSPQKTPAAVRT